MTTQLYDKVKNSRTDWEAALRDAELELDKKVASALATANGDVRALETVGAEVIVQLSDDDVVLLQRQLDARHPTSHQFYVFPHDGAKRNAALVNLVPKQAAGSAAAHDPRALIDSTRFEMFLEQLVDEKLVSLYNAKAAQAKEVFRASPQLERASFFVPADELGYEDGVVRKQIGRQRSPENGLDVLGEGLRKGAFEIYFGPVSDDKPDPVGVKIVINKNSATLPVASSQPQPSAMSSSVRIRRATVIETRSLR